MTMTSRTRRSRAAARPGSASRLLAAGLLAVAVAALPAAPAQAQTASELQVLRLEATPIGALPQLSLPMPASRDHHYWGVRVQTGQRRGRHGADLNAIAGGVDLQWRGGSVFGLTAGYQARDCELMETDCGGHPMLGARARMNLITGGWRVGAALGDHSATAGLGISAGLGYAPDVLPGMDACTIDVGMPLSFSMLQRVRLVSYITPSVVWELNCRTDGAASTPNYLAGLGLGVQQIGHRGLDAYLGLQRIFRHGAGYQIGLSFTYTHVR
jgi:hypothetical protein